LSTHLDHTARPCRCALVEFTIRKAAEEAAAGLYRKLEVKGVKLKVWWAKSQQAIDDDESRKFGDGGAASSGPPPMPGEAVARGSVNLYPSMNPNAMGARPDLK
jgi:hypothetical protein